MTRTDESPSTPRADSAWVGPLWIRRHPILVRSVLLYVIFCGLNPLSRLLSKEAFGEIVVDGLMMTSMVWPYPLLLALQHVVNIDSWITGLTVELSGLCVVALFAWYSERLLGERRHNPKIAIPLSWLGWPLMLILVEVLATGVALSLGWPTWE